MRNPTKDVLDRAIELRVQGYGMKEIMATTGLSHSQAELCIAAFEYYIGAGGTSVKPTPENVVALRDFYNVSWGMISVMFGLKDGLPLPSTPERGGKRSVRGMYEAATGNESAGQRKGHGGRWLDNDPTLYEDTLRATGTTLELGTRKDPDVRAATARLQKYTQMGWDQLVELAKELEISVPSGRAKHTKLAAAIARQAG